MNLSEDLKNKSVLITGSSRGIGKSCALSFAELGCKVGIHCNEDLTSAHRVQKEIKTGSAVFQANLSLENSCRKLVSEAKAAFSKLDILVLNHGIWECSKIENMTAKTLNRTIDLNLNSFFYLIREALPLFPTETGGAIVLLSSTAGQRGEAFYSHYAATKGAIIAMTKSLAVELAPRKIRVNAVAPGWVQTDMSAEALQGESKKNIEASIPLKKIARPEDVSPAVVFLASGYANHITGEIINVNGGSVLCG